MKVFGENGATVLLDAIQPVAHEWHRHYCALGNMELSGNRRVVWRIRALEEMLDEFWDRRRRLLALACCRTMPAELLRERLDREYLGDPVHVAPLC
jgi:hypothetical protein